MTSASLRFPDVQSLRSFEMNDDSVFGTLLPSVAVGGPPNWCHWFEGLGPADFRFPPRPTTNEWLNALVRFPLP